MHVKAVIRVHLADRTCWKCMRDVADVLIAERIC